MNGREIESLLRLIDANIAEGRATYQKEVLSYLFQHEETVLDELRHQGRVEVPTSSGSVRVCLSDLQALLVA